MKYALLTVDVETDWGGRSLISGKNKGIEEELPRLLDILGEYGIKATFFITANLLPKYKKEILKIKANGHELACHGLEHEDVSLLPKHKFELQLDYCKKLFKKEIGVNIEGFRAPQFKINKNNLEALSNLGFKYDSSLVKGILPGRYFNIFLKNKPFKISRNLTEIPVSSTKIIKIPLGLLWINNVGFSFFRFISGLFGLHDTLVIYMHPFDFSIKKENKLGFLLNKWYHFRQKNVYATLNSLIKYLKENHYVFLNMKDLERL